MVCLYLIVLVGLLSQADSQDINPCVTYINVTNVARDVHNHPHQRDILLCDRNIEPGWYRLLDGFMPTRCIPRFSCGTQSPIWLNGSIPRPADGSVRMTACANTSPTVGGATSCCGMKIPIDVRNCGDYIVYCFRRPPACPMAYCLESAPRMLKPPMLTGPEIFNNRFRFACGISFPRSVENIAFNVTWSFDNVDVATESIILTGDQRVALLEQELWRGNVGKTLRCTVIAYYITTPNIRSESVQSNGYFGGVRIHPPLVTVHEAGGPVTINVTSTLPVLCAVSQHPCHIRFDFDVSGGSWEDITIGGRCLMLLSHEYWNVNTRRATISIPIQATRDFVQDGNQELHLRLLPNYNNAPAIWRGYIPPQLRVFTVDGFTTRCSAFADPHIRTFEGRKTLHMYEVGDFVMLRSTQRPFEVDIRTNRCVGRSCVCAAVIMDENDIISVDVCSQDWGSPPIRVRILSGDTLALGTKIERTDDGRNFMISFRSGAWLRVHDFSTYLNVEVQVPAQDFGHVQGMCGTFDGNPDNEMRGPEGQIFTLSNGDAPIEFFNSWRLRPDQSLLNGALRPNMRNGISHNNDFDLYGEVETQCVCNNITGITDCGKNRVIQDPVRSMCTSCIDVTPQIIGRSRNSSIYDDDETIESASPIGFPQFKTQINFNITTTIRVDINFASPSDLFPPRPRNTKGPVVPLVTRVRAHELCTTAMSNFTLFKNCTGMAWFDDVGFLESCIEDILIAQTTIFLHGTMSAVESGCQEAILRNISNFHSDASGRRLPPMAVTRDLCPNQCNLQGICSAGRCLCNNNFTAHDCSVRSSFPPEIVNILRNGMCNVQRRPCRIAFLVVNNFHDTPEMTCRVRNVTINRGVLTASEIFITVPAEFQSSREVGCHLPDSRVPDDRSIHGFLVSISSDGRHFSNEIHYIVYDTRCLTCDRHGQCGIRNESCLISARCRESGYVNPANATQVCDPDSNQESWTTLVNMVAAVIPPLCRIGNDRFDRWDVWTSNQTGCPCFFDIFRSDCACCEAGACQCPEPFPNQCTLCGQEVQLCGTRQIAPEFGIDGWTRSLRGCSCNFQPSRSECACCQNEGCQCGVEYRNQCSPCGQPQVCGSKPDVFGGLRLGG